MTRLTEHPKVREAFSRLTGANYSFCVGTLPPDESALLSAVVAALAETETGEAMEEAAKAMAERWHRCKAVDGTIPWLDAVDAAAPLLTAPLRAELARVREERDEARAVERQAAQRIERIAAGQDPLTQQLRTEKESAEREAASLRERVRELEGEARGFRESLWCAAYQSPDRTLRIHRKTNEVRPTDSPLGVRVDLLTDDFVVTALDKPIEEASDA